MCTLYYVARHLLPLQDFLEEEWVKFEAIARLVKQLKTNLESLRERSNRHCVAEETVIEHDVPNANSYGLAVQGSQYWDVTPMTPMEEKGTYCPSPLLSYQPMSVATSVVSEVSSVAEDTVIEQDVPNASSYGLAVRHNIILSEPEENNNLVHGHTRHKLGPLPQAKIGKPDVQYDRNSGERVTIQYKLPSCCTCSRQGTEV